MHANSRESFSQDYKSIAKLAGLYEGFSGHEEESLLTRVKEWLESPASGEWVIVLDNADYWLDIYPEKSEKKSWGISQFIPRGSKGTLIICTRDFQVASRLAGSEVIEIKSMDSNEVARLFRQHYPYPLSKEDEEVLPGLLQNTLADLPLAIVNAASFMRENFVSPSRYLEIYKEKKVALLRNKSVEFRRGPEVPDSIISTYFITFEDVQRQDALAANILRLIAFLDRKSIPEELLRSSQLEGTEDPLLFSIAMGKLQALSLVDPGTIPGTFEVHRLVHMSLKAWLPDNEAFIWKSKAFDIVDKLFPHTDQVQNREHCITYLSHALEVVSYFESPKALKLLRAVGDYLLQQGRYQEAEVHFRRASKILKKKGAELEDLGNLNYHISLVRALAYQGNDSEAEELIRNVLNSLQAKQGHEHPETVVCMDILAWILSKQGKYIEAENLSLWVLKMKEATENVDEESVLKIVNRITYVLHKQGNYAEAEAMGRRSLVEARRFPESCIRDKATASHNLAWILYRRQTYAEAEELAQAALAEREASLGWNHASTLSSANNLAWILRGQMKYPEAEKLIRRVLKGREKVLGSEHPMTAQTRDLFLKILQRPVGEYLRILLVLRSISFRRSRLRSSNDCGRGNRRVRVRG